MAKNSGKAVPDTAKESFAYKFCVSVCKWFLVSLLTYLCSIPVVTMGTALCAALAVSREEYIDIREIFSSFFSRFGAYFKKTVLFFLLILLFIILQVLNLNFYQQFIESGTLLYYLVIGISIILILAAVSILRFYSYEVTFDEPLSFKQRLYKAFSRMMRCLPAAGILALLDIGLAATLMGAPVAIPLLFLYPGFSAYLTCVLINWFENRGRKN